MTRTGKTDGKAAGRSMEKEEPQKFLILHNDEINTFSHVISCLIDICEHEEEQAEQCALITHFKGSCDIRKGAESFLEVLKALMEKQGLTVTIE